MIIWDLEADGFAKNINGYVDVICEAPLDFDSINLISKYIKEEDILKDKCYTFKNVPVITKAGELIRFKDPSCRHGQRYYYKVEHRNLGDNSYMGVSYFFMDSRVDGTYLLSSKEGFCIDINLTQSATTKTKGIGEYNILGGKYPSITKTGNIDYLTGQISFHLNSNNTSNIKEEDEVLFRDRVMKFLTNGEPKYLKDYNGNVLVIAILGDVSLDFHKEMANAVADVSFSFVEIASIDDILKDGFIVL